MIAAYQRAIGCAPNHAPAHLGLGHALNLQGRFDEDIAASRKAADLSPHSAVAHSNFGFALIRMEGADNLCFGRLGGLPGELAPGSLVQLRRAKGDWAHPAQCAEYAAEGAGSMRSGEGSEHACHASNERSPS